jgi:hypothetical protein
MPSIRAMSRTGCGLSAASRSPSCTSWAATTIPSAHPNWLPNTRHARLPNGVAPESLRAGQGEQQPRVGADCPRQSRFRELLAADPTSGVISACSTAPSYRTWCRPPPMTTTCASRERSWKATASRPCCSKVTRTFSASTSRCSAPRPSDRSRTSHASRPSAGRIRAGSTYRSIRPSGIVRLHGADRAGQQPASYVGCAEDVGCADSRRPLQRVLTEAIRSLRQSRGPAGASPDPVTQSRHRTRHDLRRRNRRRPCPLMRASCQRLYRRA